MTVELDSLTIKDFESRYGIARSNVNNRLAGLKQKGYDLQPEKREGKNVYKADQIALMDRLEAHLKAGNPIASFPTAENAAIVSQDKLPASYRTQDSFLATPVSQDKRHLSHRTQDSGAMTALGAAGLIDAIAGRVVELVSLNPSGRPTPDPLVRLRLLQEACDQGWLLSTSQLAPLLGVKSLSGQVIERYGFRFTRVGRNGIESAWRIEQQ